MGIDGMTDARLREVYQQAIAARGAGASAGCVGPEAIADVVTRAGPEERRLATLDHVMGCSSCRAELDLLRSVAQAGAELETRTARTRWRWLAPVALAAALAVFFVVKGRLGPSEVVERGGADAVTLVAPAEEIAAGTPVVFSWQPVPGARRYELEVLDDQGNVALTRTTEATSATVDRLAPGASYRWWVRAVTDGPPRASALRRLRVQAK